MARRSKPPGPQGPPDNPAKDQDVGHPRTYDPDFKGPTVNRSCTDVFCCLIFLLFIIGYIVLGLTAWLHGDPRRAAYPTDSQGHFCGQKGTPNENKPVLFYFNLFRCISPSNMVNLQCPTTQICVSKCPEKFLTYLEMQLLYPKDKSYWDYYSQFCKSTAQPAQSLTEILTDDVCPTAIFPSRTFLQRCFPDFSMRNGNLTVGSKMHFEDGSGHTRNVVELREAANGIDKTLDAKTIGLKVFEDYATTWYWILIGLIIAMVLSWTFLILLRFIAGYLFWIFMFGVLGVVGYGIFYCFHQYNRLQNHPESALTIYDIGIQMNISMYFRLTETWFTLMIILFIIEFIIIITLLFLRKRIRMAIVLLKEGSKAIGCIPSTLVYPLVTFILLSICISYWVVTAVFLATSGVPVYKVIVPEGSCVHENKMCDPQIFNTTDVPKACPGALCSFAFYGGKSFYYQYITIFHLYNLFVFLWLVNFVTALGQCALAGAFASYYWAMKKPDDIPPYPLFTAFGRAVRYHTGSLAYGSLILALIQMFKMILQYLDNRLKRAQNSLSKFLHCCLKCCFWCLEKMVKFLNRNAYIMIAIYGKNFCRSTRDAFNLLMRNIIKVAVTDEVTHFILLLGKLLVSGLIGILAFLLFTQRLPIIAEGPTSLNYYWVPLLTVVLGSYLIAHGFFSVYAMCVETIFICFLTPSPKGRGVECGVAASRWAAGAALLLTVRPLLPSGRSREKRGHLIKTLFHDAVSAEDFTGAEEGAGGQVGESARGAAAVGSPFLLGGDRRPLEGLWVRGHSTTLLVCVCVFYTKAYTVRCEEAIGSRRRIVNTVGKFYTQSTCFVIQFFLNGVAWMVCKRHGAPVLLTTRRMKGTLFELIAPNIFFKVAM